MSYSKKSNILLQLQQAIKRKVTEKSKNKDQMSKALHTSVEKKKKQIKDVSASSKPSFKEARISSNQRLNQEHSSATKIELDNKPLSLFNNQNLYGIENKEIKVKKFNNRKLDKLISLIHYVISSSDKAVKYLNSTNFEAEFAVKLYKSDKQNLLNQLKNLTIDDILESQRTQKGVLSKFDQGSYLMLVEENNKLKKDIVIMEKQAQRFHRTVGNNFYQNTTIQSNAEYSLHLVEKQLSKVKDCIKKLLPFESYQQINELIQKQCRFEIMSSKCTQNSKKIAQIQTVMASLQSDKNQLIEQIKGSIKGESKSNTQRESIKIKEIQQQKLSLQRELKQLKLKINQIGQSTKLISENQLLKKNHQSLYSGLNSIIRLIQAEWHYHDQKQSPSKSSSNENLIDFIKNSIVQKNRECIQLKQNNNRLSLDLQLLKNKTHQQVDFLNLNIKNKDNQIKIIRAELQSSRNLNFDLQQKLQSLRKKTESNEAIASKTEENNKIISEQQLTIYSLKHTLQKLEEKCNANESNYNASLEQQEQLIKQLKQQMKSREVLLDDLREKGSKDQSIQRLKLEEQLDNQRKTRRQLESQVESLMQIEGRLQELMKQNMRITQIEQINENLHSEIQILRKQKEILIEEYQSERKLLSSNESEFQNIIAEYKDQITSLKAIITELKSQQQESNQQYKLITAELQAKTMQLKSVISQNAKFTEQNSILQKKIKQYTDQMKSKNENVIIENQLKINAIKQEYESKLQQYETRLQFESKQHQNKLKFQQYEEKLQQYTNKLQYYENSNEQSQRKLQQSQMKLRQYEIKLSQHEKNKNQYQNNLKQLSDSLEELKRQKQTENNQLQNKITQITAKYENQLKNQKQRELSILKTYDEQMNENKQKQREQYEHLLKQQSIQQNQKLQKETAKVKRYETLVNDHMKEMGLLRQSVYTLQEKKDELQSLLQQSKKALQDEINMTKMKRKQYCNLVKQILKGYVDCDDFADINDLEELLEFGTKKVLQIRRKQRDQQSNQRKNFKRESRQKEQQNTQIEGFNDDFLSLSEIKKKLFTDSNVSGQQDLPASNVQSTSEKVQLPISNVQLPTSKVQSLKNKTQSQMFEELKQLDTSGIKNIEDFENINENQINSSFLSEKQPTLTAEVKEDIQSMQNFNKFDQFNELKDSQMNDSMLSDKKQQNAQQKGNQFDQFNSYDPQQHNTSQISEKNNENNEDEGQKFDEFNDYQSDKMNQSMQSNKQLQKSQQIIQQQQNTQQKQQEKIEQQQEEKVQQQQLKENSGLDLQQFVDHNPDQQNDSILSGDNSNKFDQFNDYQSQKLSESMISDKAKDKIQEGNAFQQFDEYKSDQMNSSILSSKVQKLESANIATSQKQQDKSNNLDDFDEYHSNKMNDSVLSQSNQDMLQE